MSIITNHGTDTLTPTAGYGFNVSSGSLTVANPATGATAHTGVRVVTASDSAGDPYIQFNNGAYSWFMGLDNSDGNILKITNNASGIGTADAFQINNGGLITLSFGLAIKEGAGNARLGVATLVAGTVTVANTSITPTARIFLTYQSLGTITVPSSLGVTARITSTSFTITSADATDTSDVAYLLIEGT